MQSLNALRQFSVFKDPYYWRTARLIASTALFKQYRNSFLGVIWTVMQPLTMVIVYSMIMPLIMRVKVSGYLLYILSTLPLWGFLSGVLINSSHSLLSQGEILKRCMISSTIFPVADVMRLLYTYCISFATMYLFAMVLGFEGSWHVLLVPLYLVPVAITMMAVAVAIAFVSPYVRDVGELIFVSMNVMMWFSAVVYPVSILPEQYHIFIELNPLYILLEPTINLVYYHQLPSAFVMVKLFTVMSVAIAASYSLYRTCRHNFIYYL